MKNYGFIIFISIMLFLSNAVSLAQQIQNESPLLKFVPANSIFFSGNSELFNLDDYPVLPLNQPLSAPLSQNERDNLSLGWIFLHELSYDFERISLKGNSALQKHYGLAKNMALALYGVSLNPVLKITLADEQAFLAVISQAEEKSGLQHDEGLFQQQKYWSYPFDEKYQIIVAIQTTNDGDKIATLAIINQNATDYQKQLIFGLVKPDSSISNKVKKLERQNDYLPLSISFIDFKLLIKSILQTKKSANAQDTNNPWAELLGQQSQFLSSLQNAGCEADITRFVQDMPLFVGGYKQYDMQGQRVKIHFDALLELKNKNIKLELNQFRGFIPNYVQQGAKDNIFALGLGINLSQVSPFFVYVTKTIRETNVQCQPLKELQKSAAKLNPLMLAMFAGVLDGVHGMSFAIQDFKVNRTKAEQKNNRAFELSSLLTLSAENPLKVWQMMSAFAPQIAMIAPTESAQKLNLPELNQLGLELSVAIKGQHLVFMTNEAKNKTKQASIIKQLSTEKIHVNGFFQESLNYTHLNRAMKELRYLLSHMDSLPTNSILYSQAAMTAESCIDFDESIAVLSRFSGFIDYKNDFSNQGWQHQLNADVEFKAAKQRDYQVAGKFEVYSLEDGCQWVKNGLDELLADGTGRYQTYSDDQQCFIYESRYRWTHEGDQLYLEYLSERSRAEGECKNEFTAWTATEAYYINDVCYLKAEDDGNYSCLYQWDDGVLNKSLNKRL